MDESEMSYEPMDIDLSSNSVSAMDISYIEKNNEISLDNIEEEKDETKYKVTEKCLNIKPMNINNVIANHRISRSQTKTCMTQLYKSFCYIFIILLSIVTYYEFNFKCNENINISLLRQKFTTKVHGQNIAVETIIKALESDIDKKIIVLYGGTGVGKTYLSSLILEDLLKYGNIYHYTMPGFLQLSTDLMFGLIFCKSSFIVVDDLKKHDILNIQDIVKDLMIKTENNSKSITIMLLYNTNNVDEKFHTEQDENFLLNLQKALQGIDAQKYFIKFKTLTDRDLRKCIENEFLSKKFKESEMLEILKNFNVTTDGCKGVYQKIKYLSIV